MRRLTLFLLLSPLALFAGWVHGNYGNSNSCTNTSGPSVSCTLDVQAGDMILAFASPGNGDTNAPAVSDNLNGTYSVIQTSGGAKTGCFTGNRPTQLCVYGAIAATTATVTLTATRTGSSEMTLHMANFRHTSGTLSLTANDICTSLYSQTCNVTTSVANTLLIGFGDASGGNTAGTGFTIIGQTLTTVRLTSEYNASVNSAGSNTIYEVQNSYRGIIGLALAPPAGGPPPATVTKRRIL